MSGIMPCYTSAQNRSDKSPKESGATGDVKNETGRSRSLVSATPSGGIGYAYIYDFKISKVISGAMNDTTVAVRILSLDKSNLSFIVKCPSNAVFEMGCKKGNIEDITSKSGFIDNNGTFWELEYLKGIAK
jgi:hypothetical protein